MPEKMNRTEMNMREKLPKYLFNAYVMQWKGMTVPLLAQKLGYKKNSLRAVYRLLQKLHLDKKSIEKNDLLSADEVGEKLINTLTGRQLFDVYEWAIDRVHGRFDLQMKKKKNVVRPYLTSGKPRKKRSDAKDDKELRAKQKRLAEETLAGSFTENSKGLEESTKTPDYELSLTGKDMIQKAYSSGSLQEKQLTAIAKAILAGKVDSLGETEKNFAKKLQGLVNFNEYQWSLDWLYQHFLTSSTARQQFYSIAVGDKPVAVTRGVISELLELYGEAPQDKIKIATVGDSVDY